MFSGNMFSNNLNNVEKQALGRYFAGHFLLARPIITGSQKSEKIK